MFEQRIDRIVRARAVIACDIDVNVRRDQRRAHAFELRQYGIGDPHGIAASALGDGDGDRAAFDIRRALAGIRRPESDTDKRRRSWWLRRWRR